MSSELHAPVVQASAAGKIILCGEHAVVYGRPAIAVPINSLRAHASVAPATPGSGVRILARDIHQNIVVREAADDVPLARVVRLVLAELAMSEPDVLITLDSDLPIASGMGSGAAVTVAIARALSQYLGRPLAPDIISALTYEVERIHHGTPSGIDNTVIAWEKPVYFVKGTPPQVFSIRHPLHLVIGNSGIPSPTRDAVADVRRRWKASPDYYDVIFDCVGAIANAARDAAEQGALHALGVLLNENHELLVNMGISLRQLDDLVHAAREAGALGAKLTGGGQGGNIIALVEPERTEAVVQALRAAGAVAVWPTIVEGSAQV